ncbi:MAG: hypothetical protein ACO1QB_14640 [Verrucomicrobiales bacterium]
MNWLLYAGMAAVALAAADVMVKLASGKVSNSLGMLLYGVIPFGAGLVWFIIRLRNEVAVAHPMGVVYGLGVGVMFASVTFCMYAAFSAGAPMTVTSPVIRLGGLILASIAGVLIWKEPITLRYVLGLCLTCGGMYLILTR